MRVLVVDSDQYTADVVKLCLDLRWPSTTVITVSDGAAAREALERDAPDLVISEVMLPDGDGFQLIQEFRRHSAVPIIILSTRQDDVDIARGLEAGADDYMAKPFSHIEFLARVNAVIRRADAGRAFQTDGEVVSGDMMINLTDGQAYKGEKLIRMTPIEWRILASLAKRAGHVVPHQAMLEMVWGPDHRASTNHLKVHVQHLRQKLGDDSPHHAFIVTEWRTGYKFMVWPPLGTEVENSSTASVI